MEESTNIENDFFNSVTSEKIAEITADITEAGFDQFLTDGLLKDIPILGTALKGFGLAKKIAEMVFFKKTLKFLYELKDVPIKERIDFMEKLGQDEKKSKKAGEKILVILNRLDDADKASIIGKLFRAFIDQHLSHSEFLRLSYIIDRVFLDDVLSLRSDPRLHKVGEEIKENLAVVGLLRQKIKDHRDREEYLRTKIGRATTIPPTFVYEVSTFGRLLIEYGFSK